MTTTCCTRWGWNVASCTGWPAARGLFTGVIAAVVAVVVAVAMSPLMPIGIARIAELHRGVEFDRAGPRPRGRRDPRSWSSGSGCSRRGGWRVPRRTRGVACRTPIAVRVLDRATLPPTADAGMRFALDAGSGRGVGAGLDERPGRDAHDRAARRAVVVPGQPSPPARHAAPLRLELEREERRARAARPRRARSLPRSSRTRRSRRWRPAPSPRRSSGSSGSTCSGSSRTRVDGRAHRARRSAAEAPERDDARHDDAREGRAPHR